jgi:hypothetical protein
MTQHSPLIFSSLINVDLWDRADWLGIAFLNPYGDPLRPGLGLLFGNEAAAIELFSDLQQRLGTRDSHEELRVAFVEGDIPGQHAGYTVTIGSEVDRIVARAKASGIGDAGALKIATVSRIYRLPDSGTLAQFKGFFGRHGRYEVLPVAVDPQRNLRPISQLAVEKTSVHFRRVEDIKGTSDLDWIVLGKSASN